MIEPQGPDKAKVYEYHLKYGLVKINEVRARLGLEPVPDGEKLVEPQEPMTNESEFAEGAVDIHANPDAIAAKAIADASMDDLIDPAKKLLESVNSLKEFRDGLVDIYGDMDETEMGNLIQRAMTLAHLTGRFDANE